MRILLFGASGTLGKYLLPEIMARSGDGNLYEIIHVESPSSQDCDISNISSFFSNKISTESFDLIINLAAYTNVVQAEKDRRLAYGVNVTGVLNLLKVYPDTPLVHMSTENVLNPVNYYSQTKLAAETLIKARVNNYLIIRTLFKPTPFPHEKAFEDQWTTGDSVEIIAPLIAQEIFHWLTSGKKSTVSRIGTGRKRILDIAKKSKPEIEACSINDVKGVSLPHDYL